jgi:hypothetical protein
VKTFTIIVTTTIMAIFNTIIMFIVIIIPPFIWPLLPSTVGPTYSHHYPVAYRNMRSVVAMENKYGILK